MSLSLQFELFYPKLPKLYMRCNTVPPLSDASVVTLGLWYSWVESNTSWSSQLLKSWRFELESAWVCICKVHRSMLTTSALAMSMRTLRKGLSRYLPPQLSDRERSLPVPRGMMPMAGGFPEGKLIESMTDKIQPTVPSPPQAATMNMGENYLIGTGM